MAKVQVLVGTTEGFTSSVGFRVEGVNFLFRGEHGLHWQSKETVQHGVAVLNTVLDGLEAAGMEIEGREKLKALEAK